MTQGLEGNLRYSVNLLKNIAVRIVMGRQDKIRLDTRSGPPIALLNSESLIAWVKNARVHGGDAGPWKS